jgi:hypothetical protein
MKIQLCLEQSGLSTLHILPGLRTDIAGTRTYRWELLERAP